MIIKWQSKMYTVTIHNAQHLYRVENVAKHSVRYNGVLHFDPASLTGQEKIQEDIKTMTTQKAANYACTLCIQSLNCEENIAKQHDEWRD